MKEKCPSFFFTGEVAHREKVSSQTVRNWIKKGLLKVTATVNGRALISEDALQKFEQLRINPKEQKAA